MAKKSSDVITELFGFIRESAAIIHYFSDIVAAISLYNVIFENSTVEMFIIWVIVALISGVIAELLKSHLPTPLRIIFARRGNL
jgi:hypothetical protein